jgi:asparaginyl-tRNA synthetase
MTSVVSISSIRSGKFGVGQEVVVQGWVRTRRDSKGGFSFISIHDGSCFDALQVVAPESLANYRDEVLHVTAGTSVAVRGVLAQSPGKGQALELQATGMEVIGGVENPESYPISAKQHSFEHLREHAHLRVRTNTFGAVLRMRHTLAQAVHRFFDQRGFFLVHTPVITTSDCEGAGELFRVTMLNPCKRAEDGDGERDFAGDFFGKPTYLTVSGQLNLEAYCCALSKVYTFGPAFRAEASTTTRHLAEFWMVEPEMAFADLDADALLAEELIKHLAERIDKECVCRAERLADASFERLTYTEAIKALKGAGVAFEYPVEWGLGLQSEHERYLTEKVVGRPVVVVNYPKQIKPFYMRVNEDGTTVAAMDVLVPGIGEIIGGSQREERMEVLDARLGETGLSRDVYGWYRDLRRYGTVPHAGFGLGFERMVQHLTGMANIRDVIPFPRAAGSASF